MKQILMYLPLGFKKKRQITDATEVSQFTPDCISVRLPRGNQHPECEVYHCQDRPRVFTARTTLVNISCTFACS